MLAVAVVVLALAHIEGVGYYTSGEIKRVLFWLLAGVLVATLVWIRLLKPLIRLRHPWRIVGVEPERGEATTLVIQPVNHSGFEFQPGQFGWIIVGRSPFARVHHPFSFSSSAEGNSDGRVAMTIKAAGDFTNSVSSVRVGTKAYVDGPHGVFTMDLQQAQGYVFIGGGVGITPLFSMLLTMRAREDVRPVVLIYASRSWEDVIFREQLEEFEASMPNLHVVHVLEQPPPGWTGETGRIDRDLVRRHVPERRYLLLEFFICGAPAMLDAIEDVLLSLGVPPNRLNTERFDFV
jgi:predicted ferric reductase